MCVCFVQRNNSTKEHCLCTEVGVDSVGVDPVGVCPVGGGPGGGVPGGDGTSGDGPDGGGSGEGGSGGGRSGGGRSGGGGPGEVAGVYVKSYCLRHDPERLFDQSTSILIPHSTVDQST